VLYAISGVGAYDGALGRVGGGFGDGVSIFKALFLFSCFFFSSSFFLCFFFVSSYGGTYTIVTVASYSSPVLRVLLGVKAVVVLDSGVELVANMVEDEAGLLTVELGGGIYTLASCTVNTHLIVPLLPVVGPLTITSSLRMPLTDAV